MPTIPALAAVLRPPPAVYGAGWHPRVRSPGWPGGHQRTGPFFWRGRSASRRRSRGNSKHRSFTAVEEEAGCGGRDRPAVAQERNASPCVRRGARRRPRCQGRTGPRNAPAHGGRPRPNGAAAAADSRCHPRRPDLAETLRWRTERPVPDPSTLSSPSVPRQGPVSAVLRDTYPVSRSPRKARPATTGRGICRGRGPGPGATGREVSTTRDVPMVRAPVPETGLAVRFHQRAGPSPQNRSHPGALAPGRFRRIPAYARILGAGRTRFAQRGRRKLCSVFGAVANRHLGPRLTSGRQGPASHPPADTGGAPGRFEYPEPRHEPKFDDSLHCHLVPSIVTHS